MKENVLLETGTLGLCVFGFLLCVALLSLVVTLLVRAIEKADKPKIKTSKYKNYESY